mmetsp:Transcript_67493/g.158951  ORF Transcript_67493/g.158951 Transcript_67493/m.158951 type:complete len:221 (+) Transcript_67493:1034-1696(+)
MPGPQETLHCVQSDHSPNSQSTGHSTKLQMLSSSASPAQGFPASLPSTCTILVCLEVAWPQLAEHSCHSLQSLHSQSTGQASPGLQGCDSTVAGQFEPPYAGWCFTVRVRWVVPVPHETLQSSQGSQSSIVQSDGQVLAPQSRVLSASPVQGLPWALPGVFVLLLLSLPPPQLLEQPPQSAQSLHTQSTGQSSTSQASVFLEDPTQRCPPNSAGRLPRST